MIHKYGVQPTLSNATRRCQQRLDEIENRRDLPGSLRPSRLKIHMTILSIASIAFGLRQMDDCQCSDERDRGSSAKGW